MKKNEIAKGGMDLEPGTWIDGRYKILRLLGKGQEGSVYLAFQETLFRFYAVKELKKEGLCFSRESVEVCKTLRCPGLPEIADILENEESVLIVSEYIEGITLQEYLEKEGKVTLRMAVNWCLQIGKVLEYLHSQNPPIACGDLKPDNLMLQKNQIFLVDMGSLIRQGSRGKYTGTREYTNQKMNLQHAKPQQRDGYSYGILMELLADCCGSQRLRQLGGRMTEKRKNQLSFARVRRKLKRLRAQGKWYVFLLTFTGTMLTGAGTKEAHLLQWNTETQEYERELNTMELLDEEEKTEGYCRFVQRWPERAEGYLKLLGSFQKDLVMDEQEDLCYRKLWKQIPQQYQENCREILKRDPRGWQQVAYESGITYWYFYKGLEGKKTAARWFAEVTASSEEISTDAEIRQKSVLYQKMAEYQDKWIKYDETGEGEEKFLSYWKDCEQLLNLGKKQMTMTRLMLWVEMLSTWKHYLVELKHVGITRNQIEALLQQLDEERKRITVSHSRMQEMGQKLEQDSREIQGMMARIYQEEKG